jgi:cell division protein FtsB
MNMSQAPDESTPWYKRWWVSLAALVIGILGGIAAVIGKTLLKRKAVDDQQKADNKVLDERLADKQAVGDAKLEAVEAKAEALKGKIEAEHKEHTDELAEKAKADAAKNGTNPADAASALGSALERAAHKLNNGPGSKLQ